MRALSPLKHLNLAHIYPQYFQIIDFFVFLVFFIGLAQVAFSKRFEGRGGKAVVVAVGVSLSLGLAVAEAKFGFNLGSLGGIALCIFIGGLGLLFFFLLASLGMHKSTATALSFIIVYVLLQSVSIKLFDWIQDNFPIINLIFIIALLFTIVKCFPSLSLGSGIKGSVKSMVNKVPEHLKHIPLRVVKKEKKKLNDEVKTIHKGIKASDKIINQLQEMKKMIKEFGNTEHGRNVLAEQIKAISSNEDKLNQKLGHLHDLDMQIEKLDIEAIRKLKKEKGKAPEEQKARIEKEIQAECEKYEFTRKMENYEDQIKRNVDGFNNCIRSCVDYLGKSNMFEALQCIDRAIRYQIEIDTLFVEMERLGLIMKGLTKREYKAMKQEKKAA